PRPARRNRPRWRDFERRWRGARLLLLGELGFARAALYSLPGRDDPEREDCGEGGLDEAVRDEDRRGDRGGNGREGDEGAEDEDAVGQRSRDAGRDRGDCRKHASESPVDRPGGQADEEPRQDRDERVDEEDVYRSLRRGGGLDQGRHAEDSSYDDSHH